MPITTREERNLMLHPKPINVITSLLPFMGNPSGSCEFYAKVSGICCHTCDPVNRCKHNEEMKNTKPEPIASLNIHLG